MEGGDRCPTRGHAVTGILIEARELCKSFRDGRGHQILAVDHISMSVSRGSFSVLTGPSGSGKTTLLSLFGCLDRATSGSILFQGRDISRSSDVQFARYRRMMGFMFQEFALLPKLNLLDNIGYALIPRGVSGTERRKKAQKLLESLQLANKQHQKPEELSGGERQRLALARALAGDPQLVLADEPTSNLDRASARNVIQLLRALNTEGRTVIVSSHDQDVISNATHVFPLLNGKRVSDADQNIE
jgi:putative ABC transport system ATP-binding protein